MIALQAGGERAAPAPGDASPPDAFPAARGDADAPAAAAAARIVEAHAELGAVRAGSASDAPSSEPSSQGGADPFLPGDIARLELFATVLGEASPVWPSEEEIDQALGGRAVVVEELAAAGPAPAQAPGVAPDAGSTWTKAWHVQLLLPPGEHELGPFGVSVEAAEAGVVDTSVVPAVAVRVATALPEELAAELDAAAESDDAAAVAEIAHRVVAPVRGPWQVERPFPTGGVAAVAGLLVLAALLFAWWWRRRRGPAMAAPTPREPAEVEARRRLDALVAGVLLDRGDHLAHHVELSDALKTYLGRRYAEDFVDRTTGEIRRILHGPLAEEPGIADARGEILAVLAHCDLVKFAKDVPSREESVGKARTARGLIDRTTRAFEVRAEQERQRREAERSASGRGDEQRGAA